MSKRTSIVLIALVSAALACIPGAVGATTRAGDFPSLYVTFQASKIVAVVDGNGNPVGTSSGAPTVIPPGTYNLLLSDPTFVNDVEWDLAGPSVKLVTSMSSGEEPSETWVETFLPNSTYTYRDDNRPPTVWTFVTSATAAAGSSPTQAPPTSTTPISSGSTGKSKSTDPVGSQAVVSRGTLTAVITAAGTATLKLKGKTVTSLESGRYTFAVTDSSSKAGFTVQESKKAPKVVTATAFKGKKSVKLTLSAGQWFFYPTFVGKKTFFIVVN
ncbi:MAG TPA: hypothetical protein VG265_01845 [Gaiellaceae bacterium]|nr:hypothetical protein [Gaiellaceae bacterium]